MTTTRSSLLGLIPVALFAACGTTQPRPISPAVAFTSPSNNETLTATSGTVSDGGVLTIQVTATTVQNGAQTVSVGSPGTLTVDTNPTTYPAATDSSGNLTFSGVALSGSAAGVSHTLSLLVTDSGGNGTANAAIKVTVTLGAATTAPAVTFTSPTNNATLTASSGTVTDAGVLTVPVTASTVQNGAPTVATGSSGVLTVDSASVPYTATTDSSGNLSFAAVSLSGSTSGTAHTLSLLVTDKGGAGSATAVIHVTVTLAPQGVCAVTVTPADQTVFNESGKAVGTHSVIQDESLSTPGMQARIVVAVGSPCTDGTEVTLTVGGTSLTPVALTGGTAIFDQTTLPDTSVTALQIPAQALAVTASAGTGAQASSATVHYFVDSTSPTANITAPTNGATLSDTDDVDANQPGLQVMVNGTTNGFQGQLDAGIPVSFAIVSPDGGTYAAPKGGTTLAPDGTFTVETTLINGSDSLAFQATSVMGNAATSNQVGVTVSAVPTIAIQNPTPGEILTNKLDELANQPGLQIQIKMTTTATLGAQVTLCSDVSPAADGGATVCPFGTGFLIGTTSAAGTATLLDAATLGDDGTAPQQTLTAQVNDSGQTAQASVSFQVHTALPVVESATVADAYTDPSGRTWLNAQNAVDAGVAGSTVTVALSPQDSYSDGGFTQLVSLSTTSGTLASAPVTQGGSGPEAVIPVSLADGAYAIQVQVTDEWGNQNPPYSFNLYVKTALPTCIETPPTTTGFFNIQNNGGVAAAGNVQVPVSIGVTNAAGVETTGAPIEGQVSVTVNGGSPPASSSSAAAGTVLLPTTASQGSDSFSGQVTDPAGNPPQSCTGSFTLIVSTIGPTVLVTPQPDPSAPSTDGGVEVYTSTRNIPVQITTTEVNAGLPLTVSIDNTLPQVSPVDPSGTTSVTLAHAPNGFHNVIAQVIDAAGNTAQGTAPILVETPGCDIVLTSPVPVAQPSGGDAVTFTPSTGTVSSGTLTATVAVSSNCTNTAMEMTYTPSGGTAQLLPVQTSDSNGNASFQIPGLADGATGTFTVGASGGDQLTISYATKLSTPVIGGIVPAASVEIVAAEDNPFASDAGADGDGGMVILANEVDSTANAYADFTVNALNGLGPVNGNGNVGTATLTESFAGDSFTPVMVPLATGATSVTFPSVPLPSNSYPQGGTVTVTVSDNAGNSISQSWAVVTDVIPPTAPAPSATMADQRAATASLTWTVPAQGSASPTQGYELGYQVAALNATPIATPSETQYAQMTLDPTIGGLNGNPGSQLTHDVTGLPTLNQYAFELRAIDAVGNRSPLSATATTTSLAQGVANTWQTLTLNGPGNGYLFGYLLRSGDFNHDGRQDFAISAPTTGVPSTPGSVYVVYGTSDPSLLGTSFPNSALQQLTLGGSANDYFGVGSEAGDFNGDGFDDLAVGSPQWNAGQGRIDLFFGSSAGLPSSPSVTIYGDSSTVGKFGMSISAVGDVDGNGIVDFLVGAPKEGPGGSAYLFLGERVWPSPPSSPTSGPTTPPPATIITGNTNDDVGARWASVPLGDVNGDGKGDFAVGAPGGGSAGGWIYGISGAVALSNTTLSVNTQPLFAQLTADNVCSASYNYSSDFDGCFGTSAIGGVSFTGGALPDLVVGSAYSSRIWLYGMTSSGPVQPPLMGDTEGNNMSWGLISTDLNGDGHPDVLSGSDDPTSSKAYLYLNLGVAPWLPSPASAVLAGPAGSFFGYGVVAGDFQGIGKVDFAVSDPIASYVNLYY